MLQLICCLEVYLICWTDNSCVCVSASVCVESDCCQELVVKVKDNGHVAVLPDITQ